MMASAIVPQAFLKEKLDTNIWLQLPPGITFKDKHDKVLKCVRRIRSLYDKKSPEGQSDW